MKFHPVELMLILSTAALFAQAPVVENVRFDQRTDGTLLVDIYYDVTDADSDEVEIIIESSDDGGMTWTLPCTSLTGDIGEGMPPGANKHAVWDFYADNPNRSGSAYRVRVTADDKMVMDIDGNRYRYVKIGNQVWMAENLKVTHYRNGDAIPNVTVNSEWIIPSKGAYCAYDNNESNAKIYGYLYNWIAVNDIRNIAPEGWHVPTDDEWKELEVYLGMSQSEADKPGYHGTDEGNKLKEKGTVHWVSPNTGATNESGFSALPGGSRYFAEGYFTSIGRGANFWSSTEYTSLTAWSRALSCYSSDIYRGSYAKSYGFSVRCVRD